MIRRRWWWRFWRPCHTTSGPVRFGWVYFIDTYEPTKRRRVENHRGFMVKADMGLWKGFRWV